MYLKEERPARDLHLRLGRVSVISRKLVQGGASCYCTTHLPLPLVLVLLVQCRNTLSVRRNIGRVRHALGHLLGGSVLVHLLLLLVVRVKVEGVLVVVRRLVAAGRHAAVCRAHRREALAQPSELEREAGANLLELGRCRRRKSVAGKVRVAPQLSHLPVSPEEQEVTLVVQCHDLATTELGEGREEVAKHAADSATEQRREAVKDELGRVGSRARMSLHC